MTSAQSSAAPSSALSFRLVLQAGGVIVAATVILFGAVLTLGFYLPVVQVYMLDVLAVAIFLHAVLALAIERFFLRRHGVAPRELGFVRPTRRLLHLLWQIPLAVVALILVQVLTFALTGADTRSADGSKGVLRQASPVAAIFAFLGIVVLTPLWEEIFFRGMLLGAVRKRWGAIWAVVISGVLFAIVHGVPMLLPYMLTLGLLLGVLRVVHRSIWASLALHMSINAVASLAVLVTLF